MSGRHATAKELELYVLGALDAGPARGFEAHCASCDAMRRGARRRGEAGDGVRAGGATAAPRTGGAGRCGRSPTERSGPGAMAAAVLLWFGRSARGDGGGGGGDRRRGSPPMDDGAILDARNDALDGG